MTKSLSPLLKPVEKLLKAQPSGAHEYHRLLSFPHLFRALGDQLKETPRDKELKALILEKYTTWLSALDWSAPMSEYFTGFTNIVLKPAHRPFVHAALNDNVALQFKIQLLLVLKSYLEHGPQATPCLGFEKGRYIAKLKYKLPHPCDSPQAHTHIESFLMHWESEHGEQGLLTRYTALQSILPDGWASPFPSPSYDAMIKKAHALFAHRTANVETLFKALLKQFDNRPANALNPQNELVA